MAAYRRSPQVDWRTRLAQKPQSAPHLAIVRLGNQTCSL